MQIYLNFERFQTNSTGVEKLLLISSSSHIYNTSKVEPLTLSTLRGSPLTSKIVWR